jgi:hypothetical protein
MPETVATAAMTKIADEVIGKASEKILGSISKRLSLELMKVKVQFTKTFQEHLAQSFEKSQTVKTVISRDRPVSLENIYVPLTLSSGKREEIKDTEADPSARSGARYILSGTGGAGKTFLMKHLLNISKVNEDGLVPLFIELRNVQFDSGATLEDCIFNEIKNVNSSESRELFQVALEEGLFIIYLDGFDEIHPEESSKALIYIKIFSDRYTSTSVLITTRPKTGVETLQKFTIFHVQPLSKGQALKLISNTEFDESTKSKFLREMEEGLYEKHKTLMSLPILVAMMLLAYRTYADIPDRMTVFYGQAFETLYSIHDAENKELFKRQHNAHLAPDVFKKVLQAFCYLSLSNHDIEFSESLLDSYISRALKISRVDVGSASYKSDLIHNVCILQPEGLNYVFVHRSFQEYFASQFALNFSGKDSFKVIDQVVAVSGNAVAGMMVEIDEIKTKRNWALPKLTEIISLIDRIRRRNSANQLGALFSPVYVADNRPSFSISDRNMIFHVSEVLAVIVDTRISQFRLLQHLKFPTEKKLLARSPDIERVSRGSHLLEIIYKANRYAIKREQAWVVQESGFVRNLVEYRADLIEIKKALEDSMETYSELEDTELFS